jgi:hypothetical protein
VFGKALSNKQVRKAIACCKVSELLGVFNKKHLAHMGVTDRREDTTQPLCTILECSAKFGIRAKLGYHFVP